MTIMTYKFLRRLGFLTGVLLYTTHIGVWAEPEVAYKLAEHITRSSKKLADSSDSIFENRALDTTFDNCFVAQRQYNEAIKRGLYFSYRMPDWSTEFVKHTKNILNENISKRISNRLTENESWPFLEHNNKEQNIDLKSNPTVCAPVNIPNHPMKLPKIKDDITCGKRELA